VIVKQIRDDRSEPLTDPQTGSEDQSDTGPNQALSRSAIAADTDLLSTLGNDTRYEILRRLERAEGQLCVCEIEAAFEVSQGAVSQALARLSRTELVDREKRGRWRYYSTSERADRLLAVLDDLREFDPA
jgi:ArsR family transcriptional regulator